MTSVLTFFVRFAPLVYLLLLMGLILGIRKLFQARYEIRESVYGLERELAQRRLTQAITALVLVGLLGFAEVVLVAFLVPNLPALALLSTPTMNILIVPTTTLPLGTPGTLMPDATARQDAANCILGQIDLTAPKAGDELRGIVILEGSAEIPNFGFYKYEFSPAGTNTWSTIQANRKPVSNGEIGRWDTSEITPGDYQLRLVVTDNQGNSQPACVIPIRVLAP
jgi:hypothetical protein